MPIKLNCYGVLLLTAFTTLAGCQTTAILSSSDIIQNENTTTMKAEDTDSDGDRVLDQIDHCPRTPENVAVNELGCPILYELIDKTAMELRVFFKKDSSELLPKYQLELDKVADQIKKYDDTTMQIEAHISEDEMGQALNTLPKNRATMVKNYLILKHDIESSRLSTFDCGVRAPIAPSDTEEGKTFNRRVYGLVKEPKVNAYYNPADLASKICVEF
uniref:OmpA family protein n=1 Tax=Psychrobacter alimentarius TaxID=261164 RepID=UPI003FD10A99